MKKKYSLLLLLLSVYNSFAQIDNYFGERESVDITKNLDKFSIGAHFEYRANNNLKSTDNWFVAANGGYKITKWLSANLQYEYWGYCMSTHKIVPIITGTLKRENLSVSIREKYEFAVNCSTNVTSNTLRSRIRAKYQIGESMFAPHMSYEFFESLDGLGWLRSYHIAGTEIKINQHHCFDLYYLYHLANYPKPKGEHIIGLGYHITF